MSKLLQRQLWRSRRARWVLYGLAAFIGGGLVSAYIFALGYAGPEWPSGGDNDWVRTLTRVATREDLDRPLTILTFEYINGNLSAECAYRNINSTNSVSLRGAVSPKSGFAPNVTLEAKGPLSFGWRKIGTAPGARSVPATKVLAPGEACWFKVNLDPYKRVVERYNVARLAIGQSVFAEFDLKGFRGGPATRGRNIPSPNDSLMEVR